MWPMVLAAELGEETFGERLHRARVRKGVRLRTLADRVSVCWPVSHALLYRLELEPAPPVDRRRRIIAALAVIALGYEPAVFGLSRDDVPPGMDLAALDQRNGAASPKKPACVTAVEPTPLHVVPASRAA